MDEYSARSHERAAEATKKGIPPLSLSLSLCLPLLLLIYLILGFFKREIMPVKITKPDGTTVVVDKDEGIRYS